MTSKQVDRVNGGKLRGFLRKMTIHSLLVTQLISSGNSMKLASRRYGRSIRDVAASTSATAFGFNTSNSRYVSSLFSGVNIFTFQPTSSKMCRPAFTSHQMFPNEQDDSIKPNHLNLRVNFLHSRSSTILMAAASKDDSEHSKKNAKTESIRGKKNKKNIKINPNWALEADLASVFDDMAKKEGFDSSTAFYADDATFEDDFDYCSGKEGGDLNTNDFDLDDFELKNDDSYNDHQGFGSEFGGDKSESMEDRLAAARSDMDLGRVSVPKELENFTNEVSEIDLKQLGFRREIDPFGEDETPRKESFKLITNARTCSACGSDFQSKHEMRPGYLPPEKHQIQMNLAKIEEVQKLQEKADAYEWSPEDEIEWLIQSDGGTGSSSEAAVKDIDIQSMADELGLDLVALSEKKVICKRCHGLQNFGEAPELLRPGWTEEPLLSQEKFRDLLLPIRDKQAIIIALVDLFDFSGSILPELDSIAGDNPVILAANKADLLPSKMGQTRAENWVRRELEYLGIKSIANVGGAVRLVSCKTGFGISQMLAKARGMAEDLECDVYVVGAANAGKSTLINHILDKNQGKKTINKFQGKKRAGNANAKKGAVTTSPLPGTTLKFIKVELGNGRNLYDTPGLLVPGTLTQRLTPAELKMVVPKKEVEPITFRVASGKCILVGGLAKIEVVGDSKPFLFTFFVSNDIKLHPTDSGKAADFISKHAGGMLTPPLEPGAERMDQIGEFESHEIEIEGAGWKEAAADITLRGLGWVAVTGAGTAKVCVSVPKGIGITVRPPLMPFDVWEATARYTGGRAVRKSSKSKTGKRRSGVGRR